MVFRSTVGWDAIPTLRGGAVTAVFWQQIFLHKRAIWNRAIQYIGVRRSGSDVPSGISGPPRTMCKRSDLTKGIVLPSDPDESGPPMPSQRLIREQPSPGGAAFRPDAAGARKNRGRTRRGNTEVIRTTDVHWHTGTGCAMRRNTHPARHRSGRWDALPGSRTAAVRPGSPISDGNHVRPNLGQAQI